MKVSLVGFFLKCPPEYFATLFNIDPIHTVAFTGINLIAIVFVIIFRQRYYQQIGKYADFIFILTSIYLTLLIILVFYGVFFFDNTCWYRGN